MLRQRLSLSQVAFARQAGISRNGRGAIRRMKPALTAFEAAVLALRALWRDRTRRRLAITVLAALARKSDGPA